MNMDNLKAIPLSYGIGFNDLVNNKLKKVVEIKQGLNSNDIDFFIIEKIKDCNCDELKNIVEVISSTIDDVSLKRFISQISIINSIVNMINTKKCYDDDMCNKINLLVDRVESAYNKFSNEDKTNESESTIVSQCIANLKTITYKCRNIDEKADIINLDNIGKIKTKDLNESIVLSTTSEKIYSQDNPNGTNVVGRNNFKKNPNDLLNDIMTADSDEQFINRLSNIDKYLDLYKLDIDDDDLDKIEDLIKYSYDRLIDNNTGLEKLRSVLVDAIKDVKVIRVNDFQSSDAVFDFIDFAEKYIDKIKNRIYSNENDGVDYKTDAMTEFGFGFMYEYHNDMTPDEIDSFVKDLNETVDNEISMDIMEVLSEADEYKKQERKEQRKRNIQTLKFKGKELKLTNLTARNAMFLIKKLVAVALATASVAAFPSMVTLTAALSVIVMFAKTPYSKDTEKQWLYVQLKHELEKIDDTISEMSAAGDEKNKRRLIKMKAKMEMAYEKLKFMAETGGFLK